MSRKKSKPPSDWQKARPRQAAASGDPFTWARPQSSRLFRLGLFSGLGLGLVSLLLLSALAFYEVLTGGISAKVFTPWARTLQFSLGPGPSPHLIFPRQGPSDERRGYTQIPSLTPLLAKKGFALSDQAQFSKALMHTVEKGYFATYPEKSQAGLRLLDREGRSIYEVKYPQRGYLSFEDIAPVVVRTLLFIENRSLLDSTRPMLNPAIEWGRFTHALVDYGRRKLGQSVDVAGGSTLATQMEKYRHNAEGITTNAGDKIKQMVSASLRAYQGGENTLEERRKIVLDYVNTVPLAALPGYGEVNGLGDGLLAWYGSPLDKVNETLLHPKSRPPAVGVDPGTDMDSLGMDYRRVLHLFIAHRRPSGYLLQNRDALQSIGESHLRLLAAAGEIPPQLRDAALNSEPVLLRHAAPFEPVDFTERKAVNGVRARLLDVLGFPRLYDLDRLDLTVTTTLDRRTQKQVSDVLRKLADSSFVRAEGLHSFRLLDKGDPKAVIYSFTLYEHVGGFNLLRIQADNLDQPFSINEGVKLDLGSTAKLRTLVHYLEIVTAIHQRYAGLGRDSLIHFSKSAPDPMSRWGAEWLAKEQEKDLKAMLDASLDRTYSANPKERFFTGAGMHTFANFDARDNQKIMPVREALRNSVNLVFIRIMRDLVRYHLGQGPVGRDILDDNDDSPERRQYLAKFAEKEGLEFLSGFYRRFRTKDSIPPLDQLFHALRQSPKRMAAAWRYLEPHTPPDSFVTFARAALGDSTYPRKSLLAALDRIGDVSRYSLADWGYLAGIHPLELWLAGYLDAHPQAQWSEVREHSKEKIQSTYQWLFRTRYRSAQDIRIRTVLESEAFLAIHKAWQRLGYPFPSLVPSLATAIGSSADRPAALAELLGILQNDGLRRPAIAVRRLHFAEGTPYETVFTRSDSTAERVLPVELCEVLKPALFDVVEKGTAVRGRGAFALPGGNWIPLGGKTGTGDQRFETTDKHGRVIDSRVVNRTATFAFLLGDRFFGVLTAHVKGEKAAKYGFTSSLPVAILKILAPSLMPLVNAPPAEAQTDLYTVSAPPPGMADTSSAMAWRP